MIRDHSSTQQKNISYGPGGGAGGAGGGGATSSAAATGVTSAASIPTEVRFSVMFDCTYKGDAFVAAPLETTAAAPRTPLVPAMLFTYTKTKPAIFATLNYVYFSSSFV